MNTWLQRTRLWVPIVVGVAGAVLFAGGSASTRSQQSSSPQAASDDRAVPGEVLVKLRHNGAAAEIGRIAREVGADWHRQVGGAGVHLLHAPHVKARDLAQLLATRGDVAYAEPNYIVRALEVPSDPQFSQLWGLRNVGQAVNGGQPGTPGADIGAVAAWDLTTGSAATVVAVVDTGIDYTHPDLAANVWSAPASFSVTIGGAEFTCPAGTHGFNAIAKTCDPMDDHDHGTHVAGTIGAAGNNGIGVVGVNWTASIMGAKFLDADGSGTIADAIDALEFVIQAKAAFAETAGADVRVLSNSWGGTDYSQALLDEINRANDAGMLFVAAAGNDGLPNDFFPTYPAGFSAPNIVAVAATDNADELAWFSNYGASTVHLAAPGVDILSTTIGNTYSFFSGTSMATPHVSGAAALVLAKCALDTAALKEELLNSVDQVAGLAGMTITGGRLNVNNAIRGCTVAPDVPTDVAAAAGDSKVTLTWAAVAGATGYRVKRSLVSGGPYTTVASPTARTYTDTSVTNGETYYYVVSAFNRIGESADSSEVSATPKRPADLAVSALTAPAMGAAGDAIVVSDTTKNLGPGVAEPTVTRFYLSTDAILGAGDTLLGGGRAVPSLVAGASSTGSTSVTIPPGVPAGAYYVIAQADADGVVSETSELNNTLARFVQIGPDLVVSALQAPPAVAPGAVVSLTDTTTNQGGGTAGPSVVRFYVSRDALLDAGDTLLDGSRGVPSLAAGASSSGSAAVTLPANLAAGAFYLIARADANATVAEINEANNTFARMVQVGADLIVSALTVPAMGAAGEPIVISDTTKNQGAGVAAASVTRFYLSTNPLLDAGDTLLSGNRAVPSLAGGTSSTGSTSVTIPAGMAAGAYYVIAQADADGAVSETSEINNTLARFIQIGPDLVVSALQVPPGVAPGSVITLTDTTKNQGGGLAGPSVLRFYLSTNAAWDAADTLLDGSRIVPSLAAGASSAGSTAVTLPSTLAAGTYYLIAKADADGVVAEAIESNNTFARMVQVGADLIVSALTAPAIGAAGEPIVISETTKNQGAGVAAASVTRFYLSTNSSLDAGDTMLGGSRAVPSLVAGASSTGSTPVTMPTGIAAGAYYLIAQADADGAVSETSDANNTLARFIQIGPDLVVSALQVPLSVAPGSAITLTDTTKNQGGGLAGPSVLRFYLSTNAAWDAADTLLDGSRIVPSLAAGASSAGSAGVTLPVNLAVGTYYLIAKADADGGVAEASESNNTFARVVQIGADLVVSVLTAPASGAAGDAVVVTDTTKNQGGGVAEPSVVRFYLSTNPSLEAGDTLLGGSRTVPTLVAGASSAGSTSVTIPSGMAPGAYYLIAQADADGAVGETSEINNTLARFMPVGPDLVVSALNVPATAAAGTVVSLTDTMKNQGGGLAGPTVVRFYLSSNASLDGADTLLDGSRIIPSLAAGASSTGATSVTIPEGTPAGIYYVIARADADGAVAESSELNNTTARGIQVMVLPVAAPTNPDDAIAREECPAAKSPGGSPASLVP